MKFIGNTRKPKPNETREWSHDASGDLVDQFEAYERVIKGKVVGDPQATKVFTVEQLKAEGFVGIYLSE